jgi:hypothetical protein
MTADEVDKLPEQLPEKPIGWKQHMIMHLNFGQGHGYECFEIRDSSGTKMPFTLQYNSRDKWRGYVVDPALEMGEQESPMTWSELREMWPVICAAARATVPKATPG